MKKFLFALVLALLLSSIVPVFGPGPVYASGGTVTVAPTVSNYVYSYKRLVVEVAGLQWAFFSDGANIVYRTSADLGLTWSGATVVRAGTDSQVFSVATDGTYIDYDYLNLYYRRGTALGNGTLSWLTAEQSMGLVAPTQDSQIAIDTNGYPWIAYYTGYLYVAKGNRTDGQWETDFNTAVWSLTGYARFPLPLPLADGDMAVVAPANNGQPIQIRIWSHYSRTWGDAWTGPSGVMYDDNTRPAISGVVVTASDYSQDICLAYTKYSNYDIAFIRYNTLTGFGAEEILQTGNGLHNSYPLLSYCPNDFRLFAYWTNNPTLNGIYYMSEQEATQEWSTRALIYGNDTLMVNPYDTSGMDIQAAQFSTDGSTGVYYETSGGALKFTAAYGGVTGIPTALAKPVSSLTANTVRLNGNCTMGGNYTTATWWIESHTDLRSFQVEWNCHGDYEYRVTHTGDDLCTDVSGLVPDSDYTAYIVISNNIGTSFSNVVSFHTLVTSTASLPIVDTFYPAESSLVYMGGVATYGAKFTGIVRYDGMLPCVPGVQWRLYTGDDSTTWQSEDFPLIKHTGDVFFGYIYGLDRAGVYQYRATLHNGLNPPGNVSVGETFLFYETSATLPTNTSPGAGGGLTVPPSVLTWFDNLSSGVKLFLALLVTIISMIGVGYILRKAASLAIVCAIGTGFVWLIAFTIWGWLPGWVILAIVIVLALVLLIILLSRR